MERSEIRATFQAMSILVGLHHATRYTYDRPVTLGPQVVRLRPAPHCRTRIVRYALAVTPKRHFLNWQQDPHGNWLARFVFSEQATELTIAVDLTADLEGVNPFDFFVEPYAATWPFEFPPEQREDVAPYLAAEPAGPRLRDFVQSISRAPHDTVDFLVTLNRRLKDMIRYVTRMDAGVLSPEETLGAAEGSCRDTAWLLVQTLRLIGLPARFVSGYLIQLKSDGTSLDTADGVAHDSGELHAWAELYLPGAGWIGFDPTSGMLCGEGHLPLAAAPHFRSVAPVSGTVEPCAVGFSYAITVERLPGG
jgi:transglutaminase-like putative cysteine protease